MMNLGTNAYHGSPTSNENMAPSSRIDGVQIRRGKKRTALGVLSENEQFSQSVSQDSQFSKHSSVSDGSQLNFFSCPSSSSYDIFVEEACEVVLAASGEEIVGNSYCQDAETDALQTEDMRLLLELSSSSCRDSSQLSESEEVFSVDYAEDIHQHIRDNEMKFMPRPDYLRRHPEITDDMRVILVDWLAEVVHEFRLHTETLHLAVNYLDRFLSCIAFVKRSKLQLVGTAALLIAAKYEEISPPTLNQFVYITDNTYTKKELVQMEHSFLTILGFNMAAPTTNQFLQLYMAINAVSANTKNLALYIAELSLLEMDPFLLYTPSLIAAGAYCLATYTTNNKSLWPDSLSAFTGYTMAEISPCLADLHKLLISAENHPQQAIREKYKSAKYCGVSWLNPPAVLPSHD